MFATAAPLAVQAEQKRELEALVRNGTSPQRVALRCRLLATRSSRDRQSLDRAVAERIATTILALRGTEWRRLPEFASGSVGPEC